MDPTASLAGVAAGATDALTQLLLRQENLYLMVACYALLTTVQKVLPPNMSDHHIMVRLSPLYPLILCVAGVWIPGQQPADMSPGSKVLVGIILGYAVGHLHKVWKQTIRGQDARIEAAKAAKTGSALKIADPPDPPAA